ncbi:MULTISPECIES: 4'-phosphopantetheinyl transferase family protein [Vreelandella]|uniref:Enterobactin synthase component D n=2 Tax=Vreelandella TaxID=3137766 RepID=A0A7C9K788_9GAMM|nr:MULTISPECIES: 4'-phosphopantetheinyl transferase superfamily protein [Halomonas]NDL71139.1 4'-phosphopantetheinyl transferase superfamily protein [Halomonas alkaliphila]NYS46343.1 4'-phosphopantetheinyl transferase superfamily protein [Halomonas zhaodongensis]
MGVGSLERLLAENQTSWPIEVVCAIRDPQIMHLSLFPEEEVSIVGADTKRLMEFAAGRSAAHAVLKKLDVPLSAILMGKGRAPVWPAGIVGSLSHTTDACLGVAARAHHTQAIGIDIESLAPLEGSLHPDIATPEELACIDQPPELAALQIFSMKEAAYKAQYPLSQTFFDFTTLEVTSEGLRFRCPVAPFAQGTLLTVHQWTGFGMCLSLCILKKPAPFPA